MGEGVKVTRRGLLLAGGVSGLSGAALLAPSRLAAQELNKSEAADSEATRRAALKGLGAFSMGKCWYFSDGVEGHPSIPAAEHLKEKTELILRRNGIPFFTSEDLRADPARVLGMGAHAFLGGSIDIFKHRNERVFTYSLTLAASETVRVARTNRRFEATIWEESTLGYAGEAVIRQALVEAAERYVERLANDFLAANPKGEQLQSP